MPGAGDHSDSVSSQLNDALWTVGIDYHVGDGLSLGTATVSNVTKTVTVYPHADAAGKGAGYRAVFAKEFDPGIRTSADVSWPIRKGLKAEDTGYTVTSRVVYVEGKVAPQSTCWVTRPQNEEADHIHCSLVQRGLDNDWDLYLTDDRINRVAEASGAIKTDDSVSLEKGEFATESELRLNGATEVPVNSSTQFDAVLTPQDNTHNSKRALAAFMYAMLDGGKPVYSKDDGQRLYVQGNVKNQRGLEFAGESFCQFVTEKGHVDKSSGYSCAMKGDYARTGIGDGRVHYETEFTVSKNK
jgi:hypothetical protein